MKLIVIGVAITAVAAGCATGGAVPADKLARSQAAIRSAREIGAEQNGTATGYLQTARDEYATGRKLVISGDEDAATTMLLRAEADAELAMNVAREAGAIADAERTKEQIRDLRQGMTNAKEVK